MPTHDYQQNDLMATSALGQTIVKYENKRPQLITSASDKTFSMDKNIVLFIKGN